MYLGQYHRMRGRETLPIVTQKHAPALEQVVRICPGLNGLVVASFTQMTGRTLEHQQP